MGPRRARSFDGLFTSRSPLPLPSSRRTGPGRLLGHAAFGFVLALVLVCAVLVGVFGPGSRAGATARPPVDMSYYLDGSTLYTAMHTDGCKQADQDNANSHSSLVVLDFGRADTVSGTIEFKEINTSSIITQTKPQPG